MQSLSTNCFLGRIRDVSGDSARSPYKVTHGEGDISQLRGYQMAEKKEVVGYHTGDKHIYCVECINEDRETMEKIDRAITAEDSEENLYFCDFCEKKIESSDEGRYLGGR